MKLIITAITIFFYLTPAFAAGVFQCDVNDAKLKLHVEARYAASGLSVVTGKLRIYSKKAPKALKSIKINNENLSQYWLDGKDLRLEIYAERDIHSHISYADITVMTERATDGLAYVGSYSLKLFSARKTGSHSIETTGKAVCTVK